MSTKTIRWKLSRAAQRAQFVATGEEPEEAREVILDLITLTPGQRVSIIETNQYKSLDLSKMPEFDETRNDFKKPIFLSPTIYHESEPTLAQILAHIETCQAVEAKIKIRVAEKKAQEGQEQERLTALYDDYLPQVEAMIGARDYEALGKLPPGLAIPPDVFLFSPRRGDSLSKLTTEARTEIARMRREDAKFTWIRAHGSDHLKRAFEAGYNCQRQYAIERGALDAPAFTVDFDDQAHWKGRAFPSEKALDLADSVAGLGEASVVWLTHPGRANIAIDYDSDRDYKSREAVIVRNYLGKYNLVSD